MTTRVVIVNIGPDLIEVGYENYLQKTIVTVGNTYTDYVYPGHEMIIKEIKQVGSEKT